MSARYVRMARAYAQEHRPDDPEMDEAFLTQLSQEIEDRVHEAARSLDESEPAETEYLARVGQLSNQRMRAEEIVLAEFFPTPQTSTI